MNTRPKLGFLYFDYVLQFFNKSNFKGWPEKIETVTYHWDNQIDSFIDEVKRKKVDVLIGNIPATAYETFVKISKKIPHVKFVPSIESQFCNRSKENVTLFCEAHKLSAPNTNIFYNKEERDNFIERTNYPKIVKRSYGPSNYGGYFVHKVDTKSEMHQLFAEKKYHPAYIQDYVPLKADIRVMLIGHKPVCAFWRRPAKGQWLTNTSQGGSMDYANVPEEVLNLAIKASKAAKAEYWACDIAIDNKNNIKILECATAFAAFPYIRDWIGQYLMAILAPNEFNMPNIPHRNWEEIGKINSSLLRTMRDISFSKHVPFYSETGELMASVEFDNNQNLPEISMLNWYKKHMEFHLNKNKEKDLVV